MKQSSVKLRAWLKRGWLQPLLVGLGLAPLLFIFFGTLWSRPAYQFFPLALVAAEGFRAG